MNLAVILAAVTVAAAAAQAPAAKRAAVPRARAVEIYTANCQLCHGPGGRGSNVMPGLNFAGRGTWKHGSAPADVVRTITGGVPGTAMQPFKDRFTPAEIAALASLVRSYDRSPKPPAKR